MKKYIAFLRAINVGGHNVKMDALKKYFEELGFKNVETFIASGNVIFESKSGNIESFEKKIETYLHKKLGYEVATFIRTNYELEEIVNYKPFETDQLKSAQALNVAFIKESMSEEQKIKLESFTSDIDSFHTFGKEVYWMCKKKQSESQFSNSLFEKGLKIKATFRGINTVQKLAAKYSSVK